MTSRERLSQEHADLTPREQDIAVGVSKGFSNREIATAHKLAEQSVKNLVSAVMKKMKVANRVQVALLARGIDPKSE
jgi:DNA-binding NarL/FixJ family response regulator